MDFIIKYLVELILGIVVGYLGFVYKKIKKYLVKVDIYQNIVICMLEDEIIKQLKENNKSVENKCKIINLYKKYIQLGGKNIDEKLISSL